VAPRHVCRGRAGAAIIIIRSAPKSLDLGLDARFRNTGLESHARGQRTKLVLA
jgi:hypothetical protein